MRQKITSRDNQKLKHARRVRDGKVGGVVFIEGVRLAEEALRIDLRILDCFVSEKLADAERGQKLIGRLEAEGVSISEVGEPLFQSLADTKHGQGVVLVAEKPPAVDFSKLEVKTVGAGKSSVALFFSEINNPSNLGAVLRTAEAAGALGVIISKNSADAFSPKALRSAMGASLRLPIWEEADFSDALDWARQNGLTPTAADVGAQTSYAEIDWRIPRLLIFGSEAHGLADRARQDVEQLIRIPTENDVESLNLAVSCGIILFEAKRQATVS